MSQQIQHFPIEVTLKQPTDSLEYPYFVLTIITNARQSIKEFTNRKFTNAKAKRLERSNQLLCNTCLQQRAKGSQSGYEMILKSY